MNFKKRVNGSWHDIPYYVHNTSTDAITTLPAVLYPTGATATVGLKGNTVQSTTPTPQNPVMPQGCGDLETTGEHTGQYKIPISSANTTTPVYLGEVETIRRIRKLVLTGEETGWTKSGTYQGSFFAQVLINININAQTDPVMYAVCSHAQIVRFGNFVSGTATLTGTTTTKSINLWIGEPEWTVDDFKAYLAQQYAAGTPVTVWYVLATEETAVVNEPLMKIGDYADEVSNVSIPVTAGGDTISVGTTVQPSEVTANYHGWHNGAVKDYENGDWQPQVQALSLSNAPMLSNSLMAFPDMSEPEIEPETTE